MEQFRVAVAGCGSMASKWVEYLKQRTDVEIVALVDIRLESAHKMAEKHGLTCRLFTDIRDAIDTVAANLVLDVTIPESHYQVATIALEQGCHVFSEKPMASSLDQAQQLVQLAKNANRTHAVMQNRRYLPTVRALRDVVTGGHLGDICTINADFYLGPHFGGFRDLMDSPLILDMAIHTFDQARFITGADPVSVYCHEYNPPGSWYKGNASAVCIFELSNGAVFTYRGSWCASGFPTSWEAEWRVIGSRGTAIWDGHHAPTAEVLDAEGQSTFFHAVKRMDVPLTWQGQEGHFGCLDEMFASLIENRDPETVGHDNIKSVAMVFGAIESAKTGRKVTIQA